MNYSEIKLPMRISNKLPLLIESGVIITLGE